jgi:hypothetical protein
MLNKKVLRHNGGEEGEEYWIRDMEVMSCDL